MQYLKNKTAIITGAARGIGKAIAVKFAEHGANIAFTYVSDSSEDKARQLQAQLISLGVEAKGFKTNAASYLDCEEFVKTVVGRWGTVDVCVNNAGIAKDNLLLRMTPEEWAKVINTNLTSVFNITKQVIRTMMKSQSGSIINISSVIGEMGNAGQSSYAASKAGIFGFTKSMAKELGSRNIRCNAIAPGFVETDMTKKLHEGEGANEFIHRIPLKKFAQPEDIANVALFLATELSSYITGQTISVCGGLNI